MQNRRHVITLCHGLTGRGHSVSISCCVSGSEGKRGEAPALSKDVVHRAIRAICYMLETRCLLVASQESQDRANHHEFSLPPPPRPQISQFQLSLLFPLILVVILTTVLLIILLFSNSSSSCSSPVSAYVFFYFLSEQCLQQWYFKPGFHRAHRAADHISLKSHQFLSLSLGS